MKLLRSVALKKVVVWERLEAGGLPDRQAATLGRIRMNEVVAVLGDVARDRRGR